MNHKQSPGHSKVPHWHAFPLIRIQIVRLPTPLRSEPLEERLEHRKVNVAESHKLDENITDDLSRGGLASAWWFTQYL